MTAPPRRGMLVSDDPGLCLALAVIMGRCGFEVAAEVEGAPRAVAAAELVQPEAVVLDVTLTGFGGLAGLVPAIKAGAKDCSVLVVASPAFSGLRARAQEVGALDLFELSDLRPIERRLHRMGTIAPGCSCWLSERSDQPWLNRDVPSGN